MRARKFSPSESHQETPRDPGRDQSKTSYPSASRPPTLFLDCFCGYISRECSDTINEQMESPPSRVDVAAKAEKSCKDNWGTGHTRPATTPVACLSSLGQSTSSPSSRSGPSPLTSTARYYDTGLEALMPESVPGQLPRIGPTGKPESCLLLSKGDAARREVDRSCLQLHDTKATFTRGFHSMHREVAKQEAGKLNRSLCHMKIRRPADLGQHAYETLQALPRFSTVKSSRRRRQEGASFLNH